MISKTEQLLEAGSLERGDESVHAREDNIHTQHLKQVVRAQKGVQNVKKRRKNEQYYSYSKENDAIFLFFPGMQHIHTNTRTSTCTFVF